MQTINQLSYPEIPLDAGLIRGWKDIPISEVGPSDPLTALGALSREAGGLITSSIYFGEHSNSPYTGNNKLDGSLLTLFVRRSTAHRLLLAEKSLPARYHLLVFDAYRPYRVQKSLHDFYKQKLRENHPDLNSEALESETQNYVSLPSTDPARPSPHSTGGVVDVAIVKFDQTYEEERQRICADLSDDTLDFIRRIGLEMRLSALMRHHGKMLNFGTAFDYGGEKSATAYYESKLATGETLTDNEMQACSNRRLLFTVMVQAGFQPYFAEWWHFDAPESQWGAATAGYKLATFGAADLNENNRAHENERLKIRAEILKLQKRDGQVTQLTALQTEILAVIRETGDPTQAKHWPTEIIAPEK
jgi:D-alanyl-D-alanine dipeptidase